MRTMTVLAAGVVLGTAGFLGAEAPCTPVAFVNINQVFKSYSRANKFSQDIKVEVEKLQADITQREADLRKDRQDIDAKFDPGTKQYEQGLRDYKMKLAGLKHDLEGIESFIGRKQVREMDAVYKEICAEAQRIAEAKGCACVFNIDPDPITVESRGQVMLPENLKLQMNLRTALWARAELDITKDVIAALEMAK